MEKRALYILSELPATVQDLKVSLQQTGRFQIKDQLAATDLKNFRESGVLIFDCVRMKQVQLQFIKRLVQAVPHAKVLVMAHQIPVLTYQRLADLPNVAALQKPYLDHEMMTAVDSLIGSTWNPLQIPQYPRFHTNEHMNVMVVRSGLLIQTRMTDYSNGGAFICYRGISLKVGDQLQVGLTDEYSVQAAGISQLPARVVWLRKDAPEFRGEKGVGVQFVDPKNTPNT